MKNEEIILMGIILYIGIIAIGIIIIVGIIRGIIKMIMRIKHKNKIEEIKLINMMKQEEMEKEYKKSA